MDDRTKARAATHPQVRRPPVPLAPLRQWVRTVPAARIQWCRLSVDELLDTQGDPSALSLLIQKRYGLTHGEADVEVAEFLQSCHTWF